MSKDTKKYSDLEKLKIIKSYLEEFKFPNQIIEESSENPIGVLAVAIGKDSDNNDRFVNSSFISIDREIVENIDLLQITYALQCSFDVKNKRNIEKLIMNINSKMAIGYYYLSENNQIVQKYVYALNKQKIVDKEEFKETIMLFTYMIELFGSIIFDVATGKIELKEALVQLDNI